MTTQYRNNAEFADQTFAFLQKALSRGEKTSRFQPRGERIFREGNWEYQCDWAGDIAEFRGAEKMLWRGNAVFTHDFFGGLLEYEQENKGTIP